MNKADWSRKSTFEFAYDILGNVLQLLDRCEHNGTSLINCISSKLKDDFVFNLEDVFKLDRGIMENGMRCFVYQDGMIDEYVFEKERQRENPFISAKKSDKELFMSLL
ncbi:hypothetical protein ACFFIX_27135 [Metabacillus herbersteinensis]|uniref:Uncharacterized protein n=1 Tax=Metabacillus herbersteinensis TaxID=283816 RepID=A0ABV6GQ26_9BACI